MFIIMVCYPSAAGRHTPVTAVYWPPTQHVAQDMEPPVAVVGKPDIQ